MHIYEDDVSKAMQFVSEGLQSRIEMPRMPELNLWPSIEKLLAAEGLIRENKNIDANHFGVVPYWSDLIRLLQIFKAGSGDDIKALQSAMTSNIYNSYISPRIARTQRTG